MTVDTVIKTKNNRQDGHNEVRQRAFKSTMATVSTGL